MDSNPIPLVNRFFCVTLLLRWWLLFSCSLFSLRLWWYRSLQQLSCQKCAFCSNYIFFTKIQTNNWKLVSTGSCLNHSTNTILTQTGCDFIFNSSKIFQEIWRKIHYCQAINTQHNRSETDEQYFQKQRKAHKLFYIVWYTHRKKEQES